MMTELLNMRNGQPNPQFRYVSQSVSQTVTMISARDASASEKDSKGTQIPKKVSMGTHCVTVSKGQLC